MQGPHEGGTVYFILANPPDNRGGIIFPVEGNKFQVRCHRHLLASAGTPTPA